MDRDSFFGADDLIHVYTRARAIADSALVDVSATAHEAGFLIPVALTATVHADVNDLSGRYVTAGQDARGRLWDLLFLARLNAAKPENTDTSEFVFELHMPVGEGQKYSAKAMIGPGDDEQPVLTLLLPTED